MKKLCLLALPIFLAQPAVAHHPLNGMPMETFGHGLLSGVGHPLLGFDHLLFVVAAGVMAMLTAHRALSILAYVIAMSLGCLMMVGGFELVSKEAVIALSLLFVGGLLMLGHVGNAGSAVLLLGGFGLFHGSAFGDSLAGQEAGAGLPVLLGYLIGLALLQGAVAWFAGSGLQWLAGRNDPQALETRLTGALVAGAGLFLTWEVAEGAIFTLLGIVT